MVERQAALEALRGDLMGAGHVTQRAKRIGAPARDAVALASRRLEFGPMFEHGCVEVVAGVAERDLLRAEQAIKEIIARSLRIVRAGHALLEHEPALQSFLCRRRQGEA